MIGIGTRLSCPTIEDCDADSAAADNQNGYWPADIVACTREMSAIIQASAGTLQRLQLFCALLHEIPQSLCSNLTHFELWGLNQLLTLEPVLPHATRLQSLSLVELTCKDIFPLLAHNPDAFPELRELKMMSLDVNHSAVELTALQDFLRSKPRMRRLDLDLPGAERAAVLDMLTFVKGFRELEAFGMDLRTLTDEEDLYIIADRIPDMLCAIHLQTCWENLPLDTPEMSGLVRFSVSYSLFRTIYS
jgi:hypothetical protein